MNVGWRLSPGRFARNNRGTGAGNSHEMRRNKHEMRQ